jgi:hypothetical protein
MPARRRCRSAGLAWLLSLGNPARVPLMMVAINLLGIAAIGALSSALSNRLALPAFVPWAVVLWPGFYVALRRDTCEIVSTALLLAALLCYARGWHRRYALVGTLAVLARETTLPVFAGLALWDILQARQPGDARRRIAASICIFVLFAAWQVLLAVTWRSLPMLTGAAGNLGWPLVGVTQLLLDNLTGQRRWTGNPVISLWMRAAVVVSTSVLLGFCILVGSQLRAAIKNKNALGGPLSLSWLLLAAVMLSLAARSAWVEPFAYFRHFTECYVVGCLVLGASAYTPRLRLVNLSALAGLGSAALYLYLA